MGSNTGTLQQIVEKTGVYRSFSSQNSLFCKGDGGNQLEARLDKEGVAEDPLIDSPPFVTSLVFASNTMRTYGDCPLRREW